MTSYPNIILLLGCAFAFICAVTFTFNLSYMLLTPFYFKCPPEVVKVEKTRIRTTRLPKYLKKPKQIDAIFESLRKQRSNVWGFVIVRCAYGDEKQWKAFMGEVQKRTVLKLDKSAQSSAAELKTMLRWTVIEDAEHLENATMQQASLRFREWVNTTGSKESKQLDGPRYQLYIYANKASIESVSDPTQSLMARGYYVNLVHAVHDITPPIEPDHGSGTESDIDYNHRAWVNAHPPQACKQIRADLVVVFYSGHLDMKRWLVYYEELPPHVMGNDRWYFGKYRVEDQKDYLKR